MTTMHVSSTLGQKSIKADLEAALAKLEFRLAQAQASTDTSQPAQTKPEEEKK
jgi:hypothetical protein